MRSREVLEEYMLIGLCLLDNGDKQTKDSKKIITNIFLVLGREIAPPPGYPPAQNHFSLLPFRLLVVRLTARRLSFRLLPPLLTQELQK
jgi:hypothetical protein